jgi:hypothetical protein
VPCECECECEGPPKYIFFNTKLLFFNSESIQRDVKSGLKVAINKPDVASFVKLGSSILQVKLS